MNLLIEVEENDRHAMVHLEGEIDIYTADDLKERLIPLTEKAGILVTVNLAEVRYMDSTGLGIFIGALKSSKAYDSHLKLIELNQRLMRLFEITGLNQMMDIHAASRGGDRHETI